MRLDRNSAVLSDLILSKQFQTLYDDETTIRVEKVVVQLCVHGDCASSSPQSSLSRRYDVTHYVRPDQARESGRSADKIRLGKAVSAEITSDQIRSAHSVTC